MKFTAITKADGKTYASHFDAESDSMAVSIASMAVSAIAAAISIRVLVS